MLMTAQACFPKLIRDQIFGQNKNFVNMSFQPEQPAFLNFGVLENAWRKAL